MEKKITRRTVVKGGVAALVGGVAAAMTPKMVKAASSRKIRWRMQTHWQPGEPQFEAVYKGFCQRVKEASGGEVEINPLPPGAIVPTKDVFEAVGRGVFEIWHGMPTYWQGRVPVASHINGQLFSWENWSEMYDYFYKMGAIELFRKAYGEKGIHFVAPHPWAGVVLYSRRPIYSIKDFKGFKVRSTGIAADVFKKVGATPIFFPGEELYQALQSGVCEGAHWGSVAGGVGIRLHEVNQYIMEPDLANINNGEICVNKQKWDALPSDLKRLIEDCALANAATSESFFSYRSMMYVKEFKENKKIKFCKLDPKSVSIMIEASMSVVDEYGKKDSYSKKAGDMLKELLRIKGRL